jgi:cation transport protein ChaC
MALTPDLVARTYRLLADEGPDPDLIYHDDADYDDVVRTMLSSHPINQPCWIFAYGSLIWKPEVPMSKKGAALPAVGIALSAFASAASAPRAANPD